MRWIVSVSLVLTIGAFPAAASVALIPPVDAPLARRFEPPGNQWGPGHRGVDYAVAAGTAVRAAGDGTVLFAGSVAGVGAVSIAHNHDVVTTYTDLGEVLVATGEVVEQGFWIGRAGRAHDGVAGLHFGVKVAGAYADPERFLGPLDSTSAIRLAPLVWEPPAFLPAAFREPLLTATTGPGCGSDRTIRPEPPNDNVAVLVAGIGSKTRGGMSAALYESGGRLLGYAPKDTYRYSYRGPRGPALHEPYDRRDTFADISVAAAGLRAQMKEIARLHPGRGVDLIAHSQGGIVARAYLQLHASAWDPAVPPVDHLVTFSTPHEGAPLAGGKAVLEGSARGRALLAGMSAWAHARGPLPDPHAVSVEQMAPGSPLLERLDREAVLFGTRVLGLGIANDMVVPADRARWDAYAGAVVGPEGINGHDAVVTSAAARVVAHRFLRDASASCPTGWDLWGPRIGRAISTAERLVPYLLGR